MRRLSKKLDFMPKHDVVPDPLYPAQFINISWTLTENTVGTSVATYDLNATIDTPIPNAWFYYEIRGIQSNYVEGVTAPTTAEVFTDANGDIAISSVLSRVVSDSETLAGEWSITIYRGWDLTNKILLYTISGNTNAQFLYSINNPNNAYRSEYGTSVGISGNYAVVGAYEDNTGASETGRAYIYDVTTGSELYAINNPNPSELPSEFEGNYFGRKVDIDGNYAIIGARWNEFSGFTKIGQAFIYDVTTGALFRTLNSPVLANGQAFGSTVAISGNLALVCAATAGVLQSGVGYIFDITTGALLHTLNNPEPGPNDQDVMGLEGAAMCNEYAIIGCSLNDNVYENTGSAYVFDVATGNHLWTFNDPTELGDTNVGNFGRDVDINSNYAIVGAPHGTSVSQGSGPQNQNAVIYDVATGAQIWDFIGFLGNRIEYGYTGLSVALYGNYALISAKTDGEFTGGSSANGSNGVVYVVDFLSNTIINELWNQDPPPLLYQDYFGWDIGVDNGKVIVGAPRDGNNEIGSVSLFDINNAGIISGSVSL